MDHTKKTAHFSMYTHNKYHMDVITAQEPKQENKVHMVKLAIRYTLKLLCFMALHVSILVIMISYEPYLAVILALCYHTSTINFD